MSADTIRRLEHGSFSPSLDTLFKLCRGLSLRLSTLFESFELGGERNVTRELADLLTTRTAREIELAIRVLQVLFADLDDIVGDAQPLADEEDFDDEDHEDESDIPTE